MDTMRITHISMMPTPQTKTIQRSSRTNSGTTTNKTSSMHLSKTKMASISSMLNKTLSNLKTTNHPRLRVHKRKILSKFHPVVASVTTLLLVKH